MPTIKRTVTAATQDALQGLKFKVQGHPALVTLAASGDDASARMGFSVGSREFLVDSIPNIEADTSVVDTDRDVVLLQERVPAGEYFLSVPVVNARLNFILVIDAIR